MTGWTEERRKKQAEMIRKHKPWEKSTGPKTEAGKKRVSQNAFKHGECAAVKTGRALFLQMQRDFLKQIIKEWDEGYHSN